MVSPFSSISGFPIRRRLFFYVCVCVVLVVIVVSSLFIMNPSATSLSDFFRNRGGPPLFNGLPAEIRALLMKQQQLSKNFDHSEDYHFFKDEDDDNADDNKTELCSLSPDVFNMVGQVEYAHAFTLDESSCQLTTNYLKLNMNSERWLDEVFKNFVPRTEHLKKCKMENNSTNGTLILTSGNDLKNATSPTVATPRRRVDEPGRCADVTGRRVLINYAGNNCCKRSQTLNCLSGLNVGGFDTCLSFMEKSIDAKFATKNCRIFRRQHGAGLWLWKPYIIYRTLLALNDGDVVFYADSGSTFVGNIDTNLVCLQAKMKQDVVVFTVGLAESNFTKEEVFRIMGCTSKQCRSTPQRLATFVLLRKSHESMRFVGEWLTYAQDWRLITNYESGTFSDTTEGIKRYHRNDQSILSLLSKKWNLTLWPDPSQWGNRDDDPPGQVIKQQEPFKFMQGVHFIHHSRDIT